MTRRSIINAVLTSAWTITVAVLAADYAWWHGFNDGADTQLCAMSLIVQGNGVALNHDYCQRIRGRKPPVDIFRQKQP